MKSLVRIGFSVSLSILIGTSALVGCSSKKSESGDENGLSEADLAAQREGRFGSGSIPTAEGEGLFKDIYFESFCKKGNIKIKCLSFPDACRNLQVIHQGNIYFFQGFR